MSELKGLFADLVDGVDRHVVSDDLATTAARVGRRRRLRGRVVTGVATIAGLVLISSAVQWVPASVIEPGDTPTGTVGGYPTRIDRPWWLRSVGARPGPIAGLIDVGGRTGSQDRSSWLTVSESGQVRSLGVRDFGIIPVLSASGTRLMTYDGPAGAVETGHPFLWDLASGRRVVLDQITSNAITQEGSAPFRTQAQVPAFWSPDEQRLLMRAWRWDSEGERRAAVATWSGSVRAVQLEGGGYAEPAGWVDDDHLAWLSWPKPPDDPEVRISDLDGRETDSIPLRGVVGDLRRADINQWTPSMSSDGRRLALRVNDGTARLITVDLTSGSVVSEVGDGRWTRCGTSWTDGRPVAISDGAVRAGGVEADPLIRTSPRWDAGCSVWADAALAGTPHRGPVGWVLGSRDGGVLAWWWREIALGMGLIAAGVGLVRGRSALRRRRTVGG